MQLFALIARYAERFAAVGGSAHHVGSPLGVWLVLALAAPAADDAARAEIAAALGTDVDTAHQLAGELLAHPHPAVAAGLAVWSRPELTGLDGWRDGLPTGVQTGPIPDQNAADTWAREHTMGMIEQFPLQQPEKMSILLASALATKVTWLRPFDVVPGEQLGGPLESAASPGCCTAGGWPDIMRSSLRRRAPATSPCTSGGPMTTWMSCQ